MSMLLEQYKKIRQLESVRERPVLPPVCEAD